MTDPSLPSSHLGDVKVQPLEGQRVSQVAASQTFLKGYAVYENGTNGVTIVPTSNSAILGCRIRVATDDSYNSSLTANSGSKGDNFVHTVGDGAIIVCKAEGSIVLDTYVQAATSTAGLFKQWSKATFATAGGASPSAANVDTTANLGQDNTYQIVGKYIGHPGEGNSMDNPLTNAGDGDLILIKLGV